MHKENIFELYNKQHENDVPAGAPQPDVVTSEETETEIVKASETSNKETQTNETQTNETNETQINNESEVITE